MTRRTNGAFTSDRFCDVAEPVPLCLREIKRFEKFPVYVYTYTGEWVTEAAENLGSPKLFIVFDTPIQHSNVTQIGIWTFETPSQ